MWKRMLVILASASAGVFVAATVTELRTKNETAVKPAAHSAMFPCFGVPEDQLSEECREYAKAHPPVYSGPFWPDDLFAPSVTTARDACGCKPCACGRRRRH